MWVNKRERAYRRKLEQLDVTAATHAVNARAAKAHDGLRLVMDSPCGAAQLARLGLFSATLGRSTRAAVDGCVEGTTLLEGVVLARLVGRLLGDGPFVRWAAREAPAALTLLSQAAHTETITDGGTDGGRA